MIVENFCKSWFDHTAFDEQSSGSDRVKWGLKTFLLVTIVIPALVGIILKTAVKHKF